MTAEGGVGIIDGALQVGPLTFPTQHIASVHAFTKGGTHWPRRLAGMLLVLALLASWGGGRSIIDARREQSKWTWAGGPRRTEAAQEMRSGVVALAIGAGLMIGAVLVFRLPYRTALYYMLGITTTSGEVRYIQFPTAIDLGAFRGQLEDAMQQGAGVRTFIDARQVHFHQ
jgi:hypothetical protein